MNAGVRAVAQIAEWRQTVNRGEAWLNWRDVRRLVEAAETVLAERDVAVARCRALEAQIEALRRM